MWDWLLNVTCNDISVRYVTAHRCAGRLKKKLNLRSDSQRHRHFVGFFNVPVQAPTRSYPFYTVIPRNRCLILIHCTVLKSYIYARNIRYPRFWSSEIKSYLNFIGIMKETRFCGKWKNYRNLKISGEIWYFALRVITDIRIHTFLHMYFVLCKTCTCTYWWVKIIVRVLK